MSSTLERISSSAAATMRIGAQVAATLLPTLQRSGSCLVALEGALGAGKTTLVKGLATALGIEDAVTSPTFQLVLEYGGRTATGVETRLYHVDLYRIETADQLESLALEDFMYGPATVTVIEWAERAEQLLPDDVMRVRIELAPDLTRHITISITDDGSGDAR